MFWLPCFSTKSKIKIHNMIITKLQGGLGNQLFQYAAGRSLSHKLGTSLKLDIEFYKKYSAKRPYCLDDFAISSEIANEDEIKKIKNDTIFNKLKQIILGWKNRSVIIDHDEHKFFSDVSDIQKNTYLEGFWQSEKYFEDIKDVIRKEFVLVKPLSDTANASLESINKNNSVSIHIRRGDYVVPRYKKIFYECTPEYYQNAISLISERVHNPHFFVFSDDIKWSKENLKIQQPVTFVSQAGTLDYEELVIMSKCKNNIIANSTFSWWGAWLNQNADKIVIAPKKWYIGDASQEIDLIPKHWIKL